MRAVRRATPFPVRRTEGERQALLAYAVIAIAGAIAAFVVTLRLGRSGVLAAGPGLYDLWVVLAGATGAVAALWHLRARFGMPGLAGAGRAVVAAVILTLGAAIVAGTLILPPWGTMFGPFLLLVSLAAVPLLGLCWLAALAAAHLLHRTLRAERETIFRPRPR